jgi:hypothetical protein
MFPTFRRRAKAEKSIVDADALRFVTPFNDAIGPWQISAARLQGVARHGARDPAGRSKAVDEVAELAGLLYAAQTDFTEMSRDLRPAVATASQLADTRRAMQVLAKSLDDIRALLAAPFPGE